ncbi:MAG: DUF6455 family protein [Paracoccaceae bacterium]
MSDILDRIAGKFDRRMALRRKALAHMEVFLSDDDAVSLRGDLRATILACQSCSEPAACTRWMDRGAPGLPACCRALASFERLQAASVPQEPERLRATA